IEIGRGVPSLLSLRDFSPLPDSQCPSVSILVAARDEDAKLPAALSTFLALDYPRFEVIAVDDRSVDATGAILQDAARGDPRMKALRIDSLPPGWLGKPHALLRTYK